jgi:hypothetical protein
LTHLTDIFDIIVENANESEVAWLEKKVEKPNELPIAFVATPRFIRKVTLHENYSKGDLILIDWTLDRLARVYLLLSYENKSNIDDFEKSMHSLFETAEIKESVALYSALPLLQKPEKWLHQATDAVRSNIGDVFDALAFNNAYPAKYFTELAWNQLVMKCIFNDKSINRITDLKLRMNARLADIFVDFVHERWAAGRSVPSNTWQIVVNFVNDERVADITKLFETGNTNNLIAASLVCNESNNLNLRILAEKYPLSAEELSISEKGWLFF